MRVERIMRGSLMTKEMVVTKAAHVRCMNGYAREKQSSYEERVKNLVDRMTIIIHVEQGTCSK